MADFENKNNAQWNENGAAQNADNTTNNSGAANTAEPAGNAGSGVNGAANPYAYQNGYYRNTTPHQDEAVHSSSRTLPALPITIRQAVRPLPPETAAAATTAATLM